MAAPVVRCLDLDVLGSRPAVAVLEFDTHVRKLHVSVLIRERVRDRPSLDLVLVPEGLSVAVRTASIRCLEEPLVLAL